MYLHICTLFSVNQSISFSVAFQDFPAPKRLWAKQIQSAHIPSNPTAADRWLSLQTREAFIYSGLSCRPSVEEKPPMWAWTMESIWASKAPEGLWGCCQQEKKWLHSLTWWVFGFRCHRSEALSDRVLLFKCPFEVGARKVTTLAVTAGLVQWQADGRNLSLVLNLSGFFGLLVYSKVKRNVKLSDPVPGHYQNVPWQGLGMM